MSIQVPELYEGSNLAAMLGPLEAFFKPPKLAFEAAIGCGLVSEAAYQEAPPRMIIVGPQSGEKYRDPRQQRDDGIVCYEAIEQYVCHIWGRNLKEAQALRQATLGGIWSLFSPHWGVEIGPGTNDGGSQGGRGWVMTIPFLLVVPIFAETFRTKRLGAGISGQVVDTLDPPDPSPDPIPGLP